MCAGTHVKDYQFNIGMIDKCFSNTPKLMDKIGGPIWFNG